MLTFTSVYGNIFDGKKYESIENKTIERIKVSRLELEKKRIRKKTDAGTDIGIILNPGERLHHGDMLSNKQCTIVIEQLPEKVMSVRLKDTASSDDLVILGHIIGNRHRPISIKNDTVSFPIQADSEITVFQNLFAKVIDRVKLSIEEVIFSPHAGADIQGHE